MGIFRQNLHKKQSPKKYMKKPAKPLFISVRGLFKVLNGRGERIRTSDLFVPNEAR